MKEQLLLETRAKEVRKSFDKMVTYGKKGTLVSRRLALAFYIMIRKPLIKYLMIQQLNIKIEMVVILELLR